MWFRQDLRLTDNPALSAAVASGAVLPVYLLDDSLDWPAGGAGRWWLHHSLASLARDLRRLGAPLVLRRGPAAPLLAELAARSGATRIVWNRVYEPAAVARDTAIKAGLKAQGLAADSFNAACLVEPWALGRSYKVFTPFWRALQGLGDPPMPEPAPTRLTPVSSDIASDDLDAWKLRPAAPDWAAGLRADWAPGEAGAAARLDDFLPHALAYKSERDRPDHDGTSRLSPHLHFGEIGPRQVWHAIRAAAPEAESYLRELAWREFSIHLLHHVSTLPEQPLREAFVSFPWRSDVAQLRAWQRGRTGYPIVDAGMRQLWRSGWMHNRVRMVAASFLIKHLLLPWQLGEAWFWDTLVDADLASNAASWQWVAGCGADAAPYFRIFNPELQGRKFDPDGAYVRRWVPELSALPGRYIHAPWTAPSSVMAEAGLVLGRHYPKPIVDHSAARARALAAFQTLKGAAA